ncbi:tyrosine-type recombinase/integrase [Rhodospirillum sp. A1_3_36]|uniref:tyrosine-type recombinase/integrase n=1 Tax=Rhodospirillum sp. A1_3_36 TaxID=3391666 RepID=UPI0039A50F55
MSRHIRILTAREVEAKSEPGYHADGDGLYLQVTAKGAKSWIYRFSLNKKRRDMGLGSFPGVGLAKAREKCAEARALVRDGKNPIEERKLQNNSVAPTVRTFRDVAYQTIEQRRPAWKNAKHAGQWTATLETYAFPMIGDRDVGDIGVQDILDILKPIWATKTETADRVRGRIEAVLDTATALGWRSGDNPARWKGTLSQIFPAKGKLTKDRHHASVPYADMPEFWPRLQAADGMGARALELVILTAGRSGEILHATWDEFDLKEKAWLVPACRMKANRDHRVPLSDPALALLRKMATIRVGNYVFPGRGDAPLSNMTMRKTMERIKVTGVPHGFRATFRTWIAEKTSYSFEIAELALAHTPRDKVVAAYQRGDLFEKRRELMNQWARYICQDE